MWFLIRIRQQPIVLQPINECVQPVPEIMVKPLLEYKAHQLVAPSFNSPVIALLYRFLDIKRAIFKRAYKANPRLVWDG